MCSTQGVEHFLFIDVLCSEIRARAIVEILLGNIHQRKQRAVKVDELAKDVNALLRS